MPWEKMNSHKICLDLLSLDPSIIFAWIVTVDGKIIAAEYRPDIVLSIEESELAIMQALIRMNTRRTMEHKTGRPIFSITEYEQEIRSTVLVHDSAKLSIGNEFLIIVSLDKQTTDPYVIVKNKVLKFIGALS